jgi:hypothetical protein
MNKNVIIIGALSLIGVGAFLYFKPKKTNQNIIPSTAGDLVAPSGNSVLPTPTPTPTSTLSVPPTQSNVTIGEVTLTTPVQVVETALKISEAKDIANRIFGIRNKINRYSNMKDLREWAREADVNWTWENELPLLKKNYLSNLGKGIKELDKNLALLGYVEVNGSIQKI